jgi:hypothetical protein
MPNNGDPLKKVLPGQPMRLPAAAWNAFIDATRWVRERANSTGGIPGESTRSTDIVKVRNISGADVERWGILAISRPIIDPTENEEEFESRVMFDGENPGYGAAAGCFVILLDPILDGEIGRAIVSGVTCCRITGSGSFAEAEAANTTALLAGTSGSARILWAEDGAEERWAVVRLGDPGSPSVASVGGSTGSSGIGSSGGSGSSLSCAPDDDGYPDNCVTGGSTGDDVKAVRDSYCIGGLLYVTRGRLQVLLTDRLVLDWYDLETVVEGCCECCEDGGGSSSSGGVTCTSGCCSGEMLTELPLVLTGPFSGGANCADVALTGTLAWTGWRYTATLSGDGSISAVVELRCEDREWWMYAAITLGDCKVIAVRFKVTMTGDGTVMYGSQPIGGRIACADSLVIADLGHPCPGEEVGTADPAPCACSAVELSVEPSICNITTMTGAEQEDGTILFTAGGGNPGGVEGDAGFGVYLQCNNDGSFNILPWVPVGGVDYTTIPEAAYGVVPTEVDPFILEYTYTHTDPRCIESPRETTLVFSSLLPCFADGGTSWVGGGASGGGSGSGGCGNCGPGRSGTTSASRCGPTVTTGSTGGVSVSGGSGGTPYSISLDTDLEEIAALTGAGYLRRIAEGDWTLDTTIPWGSLSGTPTTLSGYGITNGVDTSRTLELIGTTNRVSVSPTGAQDLSVNRSWTISLPQDIHTSASVTFAELTVNTLTVNGPAAATVNTDLEMTGINGLTVRYGTNKDGVRLRGRNGGTIGYMAILEPATLSATRIVTLPDADVTLVGGTMIPTSAIGVSVQAYDAELAAIAVLVSAADRLPYFTGSGTAALATFTTAGRNLVDDATVADQRTTLEVPGLSTANTFSANQRINGTLGLNTAPVSGSTLHVSASVDSSYVALIAATAQALRLGAAGGFARIEGVDQTGFTSWQPLSIGGSRIVFATSGTQRMSLTAAGNFVLGAVTVSAPSGGGQCIVLGQSSDPTGIGSNTSLIYSKDIAGTCETHTMDEAGNITQLSPHAMDGPAWLYDSDDPLPRVLREENVYLGYRRWTNESRRARLFERMLAGEDLSVLTTEQRKVTYEEWYEPTEDWDANQLRHHQRRIDEIAAHAARLQEYQQALSLWQALPLKQRAQTDRPQHPGDAPVAYQNKAMPAYLRQRLEARRRRSGA